MSECGGNTNSNDKKRYFSETLFLASLTNKYCRIIRVHFSNSVIFFNLTYESIFLHYDAVC